MPSQTDLKLGIKDAAQKLNLSEGHVRRLADRGEIPHERDSQGRRLFAANEIQKIVARRR